MAKLRLADKPKKIESLPVETSLDLNPEKILSSAIDRYSGLILIGWDKSSDEMVLQSSISSNAEINWMLDQAKLLVLGLKTCQGTLPNYDGA